MFDNKRETLCQKKSVLHCSISQLQHNSNNGKVRPVICPCIYPFTLRPPAIYKCSVNKLCKHSGIISAAVLTCYIHSIKHF